MSGLRVRGWLSLPLTRSRSLWALGTRQASGPLRLLALVLSAARSMLQQRGLAPLRGSFRSMSGGAGGGGLGWVLGMECSRGL